MSRSRLHILFTIFLCVLSLFAKSQTSEVLTRQLDISDSIYASIPDSSYSIAQSVNAIAESTQNKAIEARAKSRLGRYLLLKAELEDAEKRLNQSLQLYIDLKDYDGQAYVYKLKAILQGRIGNIKDELECLEKSVELYKKINNSKGLIAVQLNLALTHLTSKNPELALPVLNELKSEEDSIQGSRKYFYYQNWSKYHSLTKNYASAMQFASKAADVAKEFDMKDSYITILTLKAQISRQTKDFGTAEKLLAEAENLCFNGNFDHELDEAYTEFIRLYTAKGAYEKAFYYLNRQNDLKQKMYNIEKVNSINALEKKLQLADTEKQLAEKKLEVEHEKLKYEKSKSQIVVLLFVVVFVILVAGFVFFLYFRVKSLKNKISEQKQSIEEKSKIIEESYKNIKDSIVYSKQLQDATLPTQKLFQSHFPESFIFYKPKDIVAGDFYWLERVGTRLFFAVADCTGHGVPGALVSVVCNNALNRAVKELNLTDTGKILDKVRDLVIENFARSEREVKDGMDIAFCCFEYNATGILELKFSGANNPVWIFRKNVNYKENVSKALGFEIMPKPEEEYLVLELSPNKQPIGVSDATVAFHSQTLTLQAGDTIYAFTDGIIDQFGGKEGKKLKRTNFKKMLLSMQEQSMAQQQVIMHEFFDAWKNGFEQVDDVCVVGIKI